MPVHALLMLLLLPDAPESYGGQYGWRCSVTFEMEHYRGGMWRDFGAGAENSPYMMQAWAADPNVHHEVYWTVDPRPEGPPPTKKRRFLEGLKESEAFAAGPEYVHIDFGWYTEALGPIWAHYWGGGAYAGADLVMTARQVRKSTGKDGKASGLSGGLFNRRIMTALAATPDWTVTAVDAAGRTLFSESFRIPSRDAAEREFRRGRAAIDALEPKFRVDHRMLEEAGAVCVDHEDPASGI